MMKNLINSITARLKALALAALLAISIAAPPVAQVAVSTAQIASTAATVASQAAAVSAAAVAVSAALTTDAYATAAADYLENKIIDWLFRGQAFTPPATIYVSLHTGACSDSSGGTEVSGGSYARIGVAASLANWAGTQSAGSTTASSGTGGTTSNNGTITFAAPTANWGSITHVGLNDAVSGGNPLACNALTIPKTVNNGDAAPSFGAGALTFQVDN